MVACGGLDNVCSIYNLNSPPDKEGNLAISGSLTGHSGYISCCKYIPTHEERIVTCSQDRTCRLWDAETQLCISVFGGDFSSGHTGDVMRWAYAPPFLHQKDNLSFQKSEPLVGFQTFGVDYLSVLYSPYKAGSATVDPSSLIWRF